MRSDMSKVIVERPRTGGKGSEFKQDRRTTKHFLQAYDEEIDDDLPNKPKVSIQKWIGSGDHKELNENLNPLQRYFESKVGQKWDDIFSEVCENISLNNAVQKHILDHVKHMVKTNNILCENGRVYSTGWSYSRRYVELRDKELYVHPETGILCKYKRPKSEKSKWTPFPPYVKISHNEIYIKLGGLWWYAHFTNAPIVPQPSQFLLPDKLAAKYEQFYKKKGDGYWSTRTKFYIQLFKDSPLKSPYCDKTQQLSSRKIKQLFNKKILPEL